MDATNYIHLNHYTEITLFNDKKRSIFIHPSYLTRYMMCVVTTGTKLQSFNKECF